MELHNAIFFQRDGHGAINRKYSSRFTLWNTYRGNTNITFVGHSIEVPDPLQPNNEYRCIFMALLFGTMPSWHSMPCNDAYPGTLICKTRVKTIETTARQLTSEYQYIKCNSREMFVIDRCFSLRSGAEFMPKHSTSFKLQIAVQKYFVHLFSFVTWLALQKHQVVVENHIGTSKLSYCVITDVPKWSQFEYTRHISVRRSICKETNQSTIFYINSIKIRFPVMCGNNQFQCDDGTCISHKSICNWPNECSPSNCVCWVNEGEMYDVHFCRYECLPNKCSCSKHNFQCAAGGCIQVSFVCDGEIDCHDGSDELCTIKRTVSVSVMDQSATEILLNRKHFCFGFLCPFGKCISLRYVNDLMSDCSNRYASDEYLFLRLRFKDQQIKCTNPQDIPCVAGLPICFSLTNLCLYDFDRYGNTRWCRNGAHLGDCATINCTNSYKCSGSYCIPFHRLCDGHSDCIHGEDEEQCDEYICKGFLRCSGAKMCVHPDDVCDGINHCPNADDENLCDVMRCPFGCNCLSYSSICTTNSPNVFPVVSGDYVKHLSIINSFLPLPNVHNICKQTGLLILNLTRNNVTNICGAFQNKCVFHDTLIMLDLTANYIMSLKSFCFVRLAALRWLSLAHNPLMSIDDHVFQSSLMYIDIRDTNLEILRLSSFQGMEKLEILNIIDLELSGVIGYAETLTRYRFVILFNDKRLCCLFTHNTHCTAAKSLEGICRTLLPHRWFGYMITTMGVISIILNMTAVAVNCNAYRGRKLSILISFLCVIDTALATYLPFVGIADIYFDTNFVLVIQQWVHSRMCNFMDALTASGTMISLCLSALLIFLTGQGVTNIKFNMNEIWHKIVIAQVVALFMIITFNISLTVARVITNDFNTGCNMMANTISKSWPTTLFSVTLDLLMLIILFVITLSTVIVIKQIVQSTKDVEAISGRKSGISDTRRGVCNFLIAIVIVKYVIILPYPFLQLISLLGMNISEYTYQYITATFIILESFCNPVVFVLRPRITRMNLSKTSKNKKADNSYSIASTNFGDLDQQLWIAEWRM